MKKQVLLGVMLSFISAICLAQENPSAETMDFPQELLHIKSMLLSESRMDSIVDRVVNASYALKMTEAEIASLKEEARMERKSWMRSFTVGVNLFGYNVTPVTSSDAPVTTNATQVSVLSNAAMTVLISPYDLIGLKNRARRARERVTMQEMTLQDKRKQVKIYIINKFLDYQAALETYIISESNLMMAEEMKVLADSNFKSGRISNAEYNQALSNVMKFRTDLIKVENAVMKLKYEIELLMEE